MKKMKKLLKRSKLNNKGMSLVEVLVAMMILAIAGISFLRSFSYAAEFNRGAREKQHALTLAQSVMEGFKAYDMYNIDAQFRGTETFNLYDLTAVGGSAGAVGSEFGHYQMSNVTYNGYKFDVKIDVSDVPGVEADNTNVVLKSDLPMVASPNKFSDAFFMQNYKGEMEQILADVWAKLDTAANGSSYPGLRAHLDSVYPGGESTFVVSADKALVTITSRRINLNITASQVTVSTVYTYSVDAYPYTNPTGASVQYPAYSGVTKTFDKDGAFEAANYICFDNSTSGVELGNIYLYFFPAYDQLDTYHSWFKCDGDSIFINNNSGSARNVFLIKQQLNVPNPTSTLANPETWYKPNVFRSGSSVNLYHNLKKDMSDVEGAELTNIDSHIHGFTDPSSCHSELWYKDTSKTLVYNIDIYVTPAGNPAKEVYHLKGSTNTK